MRRRSYCEVKHYCVRCNIFNHIVSNLVACCSFVDIVQETKAIKTRKIESSFESSLLSPFVQHVYKRLLLE